MNSQERFKEIYNGTKQSVLRYISAKCLNIADIEDLFQETYLRVYDSVNGGCEIAEPEAFCIGIAKHCLSHYYTKAQRLKARISLSAGKDTDEQIDIKDETDIRELVENTILYDEVFKEICRLPSDVQRIFYLHYFLGLSLNETASLLGMSFGQTTQRLYKAIRQLRKKYIRR